MQYFGGKAKIAKELAAFINTTYLQGNNKPFIDAFCGSCNIISKIDDKRIRIANDKHKELMAMWQWAQYRDWETDRKSTRLNSSHSAKSRMPSSA